MKDEAIAIGERTVGLPAPRSQLVAFLVLLAIGVVAPFFVYPIFWRSCCASRCSRAPSI